MSVAAEEQALAAALAAAEAAYLSKHPQSAARHAHALRFMPGGNTRSVLHYAPFPLTWTRAAGNRLTDLDGGEYVDLLGEYSAGLYGHSNPVVNGAIKAAVDAGTVLGGPNVFEGRLAEAICARFPSIELVRFTNSGTEANLMALALCRALAPDRSLVLVFAGGYHGGVLDFRNGIGPLTAPGGWLLGTYNDVQGTRTLLRENAARVAAVLVEPMLGGGCIPGTVAFLEMLRNECSAHGIALIFDEVMTSRLSTSGLQGLHGIRPDLTTLGKYLGGGASFGAFGGRAERMQWLDPGRADSFAHAGTFNNNVMSMAGGLAGLTEVFTPAACSRLNALGDHLRERLIGIGRAHGVPFLATGVGSLIGLHFARSVFPVDPLARRCAALDAQRRSVEALFHLAMLDSGFYLSRRGYMALSLPTTADDCEGFSAAVDAFLVDHRLLLRAVIPG
jgi:glutamate-1-semialdehyde 2,1-aminomutase